MEARTIPPAAPRRAAPAAALLLPLLCSSCFTMMLWGFTPEEEHDPSTGESATSFAYDEETEWSWELFLTRILLTPISLGLDCLTSPVQACLYGGGDDEPCDREAERR